MMTIMDATSGLKACYCKVTTASTTERKLLFGIHFPHCLQLEDFSEVHCKAAARIFALTLDRYHDKESQQLVKNALTNFVIKKGDDAVKVLIPSFLKIAGGYSKYSSSKSQATTILTLLQWTNIILQKYGEDSSVAGNLQDVIRAQTFAVYSIAGSECTKKVDAAYRQLKNLWKKFPSLADAYLEQITTLVQSQVEAFSMLGHLSRYLQDTKQVDKLSTCKGALLDSYMKYAINTKVKPKIFVLMSASPFIKQLSHDDFKSKLLTGIQKALLRNPEIVIEAIAHVLKDMSLDLSQYAADILKSLSSHLHSQHESTRGGALEGSRNLAMQCSDSGAIETGLIHLFGVLGGSEGKLTVVDQRIAVLKAIEHLHSNAISGASSLAKLGTLTLEKMTPFLLQEGHEGTLIQALKSLRVWCCHFGDKVPDIFPDILKKGLAAKTSTATVRMWYFKLAIAAYSGNTLHQAIPLVSLLLQHAEKVKSQGHQISVVGEALGAVVLLAKIATLDDVQYGNKMQGFFSLIVGSKSEAFTSEKLLTTGSDEVLQLMLKTFDVLFTRHCGVMDEACRRPWYRALAIVLLHPSWKIRQLGRASLNKLYSSSSLDPADVQSNLLQCFRNVLKDQQDDLAMETKEGDQAAQEFNLKCIPSRILSEAVRTIALTGEHSEEANLHFAFNVLTDAYHDRIVSGMPHFWLQLLHILNISATQLVERFRDKIVQFIEGEEPLTKAQLRGIKCLVKIDRERLVPIIINTALEVLQSNEISQVTVTDYGIMKTEDGELYDRSVLEGIRKGGDELKNVKKESKAYSYTEQKMDLELREELKKKKGNNQKTVEAPKLTKKQQEVIDSQLGIEKAIRDRLKKVDQRLKRHIAILLICIETIPDALTIFLPQLVKQAITLLSSPMAAPHVSKLFIALKAVAFEEDHKHVGDLIGYATLRSQHPACDIDSNWCEEDEAAMIGRGINALYTFTTEQNVPLLMTYTYKRPFATYCFAYFLPLLQAVLTDKTRTLTIHDELRQKVLQLFFLHSKKRHSFDNNGQPKMEDDPDLLPRSSMMQILSTVIVDVEGNTKEAKIQKAAQSALIEVCKAASGDVGSGFADDDEILILLGNLLSKSHALRKSSMEGLLCIVNSLPAKDSDIWDILCRRVLTARFDPEQDVSELASSLYEKASLDTNPTVCHQLLGDIVHPLGNVRTAAGNALRMAMKDNKEKISQIIEELITIYMAKSEVPPPILDSLGRVVSAPFNDPWEARDGVAIGLEMISDLIPADEVVTVFSFYVPTALGDRNENVRKRMLDAAIKMVNDHGKDQMLSLLSILEEFLDAAPDSSAHDTIRQSAVILMGSLAKHLDKTDSKIKPIFNKLMDTLMTPSQQVQEAVANCLPPLCPAIKDEAGDYVKSLLEKLLESEKYGERRGAAYGLAGLVKGFGILTLKQQNIIATLTEAIQNKKVARHREGALFAFETLCGMLGRLFEPYVVHLLPHLLLCFGDGNQYVREAADETAKAVMRNLSAHGVKLILPSLLKALEEDSWRTKTGSVELLGAMAFCAPKQLSSCLPSIVPRLTEVLADSHLKVQKAGQQALKQIGGVIRNPEIQEISPIILAALADPASKTVPCLQALLNTSFVHFIDSPSLALIMPCLERAMEQRSTETKKMSAQILGNMYALTDQKDLSPYLSAIVPGLKRSLLDPSPEVRAVSARALGAMVKGMGEEGFDDLLPWLLETLTSENSSVDRSGAAQGLAEVLHGLGVDRLEKLMPDVIATTSKVELAPHVREGYLMLYIYLPATFGEVFVKFIGPIIPSILKGLADESEFVRETSLKAGQRIINMYADSAISLLLPELENGLFDDNWRIRLSSVQLLGDLLYKITGVTGKMTTVGEEDDNFGTSHSTKAILTLLGPERRNRVLAGLYMGRSDVALMVRQSSLHVWKIVVQNTARTLREILPTLFALLLGCLASTSVDKRQIAARTLGDLVRKLGERILPEIIPILEHGLNNGKDDERQGVCIGLSEIMGSTSREMVMQFEDSLIETVKKALLDDLAEVRAAAADAFRRLFEVIDRRALEGVLPYVLRKLDDPDCASKALDAIKQIISSKGKDVLPFLVPKLIAPPVNTRALAILSSVAGDGLTQHISKILPAMLNAMEKSYGTELEEETLKGTKTLVTSIEDDVGIRTIVDELLAATRSELVGERRATGTLLATFCKDCSVDYGQYIPQLLRGIIFLMNDRVEVVAEEGWGALGALVKRLDPAEQVQHIPSLRQAIKFIKEDLRDGLLPGFCIPKKGITPILPIFREGILSGSQDVKEQAANGLGEVIRLTSAEALKPSVVSITGPLIRILGDRFAWNVKVAILGTITILLGKVGIALKPFLPQLQTTFVKALNDQTLAVRQKAVHALKLLTVLHTRVDSLFTELRNGIKNNEESSIRETMLQALRGITLTAGKKMSEAVQKSLSECLTGLLGSPEDAVRVASGSALGALFTVVSDSEMKSLMDEQILDLTPAVDWTIRHGRTVTLSYALYDAPDRIIDTLGSERIVNAVMLQANADRVPICVYGMHSLGHLMMFNASKDTKTPGNLVDTMRKALLHTSNDIRIAALQTLKYVSKVAPNSFDIVSMGPILAALATNVREKNTAIRALAEAATYFCLGLNSGDEKYQEAMKTTAGDTNTVIQEINRASSGRLAKLSSEHEDYPFAAETVQGEG